MPEAKPTAPYPRATDLGTLQDRFIHTHAGSRTMGFIMGRSMGSTKSKSKHKERECLADSEIRFAGYLVKQGSFWHTWRKRYFILRRDRPLLCYYASASKLEKLGEVTLDAKTVVERLEGFFCHFCIKNPDRKLVLNANDGGEIYMNTWIDALNDSIRTFKAISPVADAVYDERLTHNISLTEEAERGLSSNTNADSKVAAC